MASAMQNDVIAFLVSADTYGYNGDSSRHAASECAGIDRLIAMQRELLGDALELLLIP